MKIPSLRRRLKKAKGFTLIELLVVVLIIGILASVGLPQYLDVVERGKVAEATSFFTSLAQAQERILARDGAYANTYGTAANPTFDIDFATIIGNMKYFTCGNPVAAGGANPSFTVACTRAARFGRQLPAIYGAYVLTYRSRPGVGQNLVICAGGTNPGRCTTNLVPN